MSGPVPSRDLTEQERREVADFVAQVSKLRDMAATTSMELRGVCDLLTTMERGVREIAEAELGTPGGDYLAGHVERLQYVKRTLGQISRRWLPYDALADVDLATIASAAKSTH